MPQFYQRGTSNRLESRARHGFSAIARPSRITVVQKWYRVATR
jgi:hypothetical protein